MTSSLISKTLLAVFTSLLFQIKVTLLKLEKPDEACQFADACCDWLSKTLCDVAFSSWRYSFNNVSVEQNTDLNSLSGSPETVNLRFDTFVYFTEEV